MNNWSKLPNHYKILETTQEKHMIILQWQPKYTEYFMMIRQMLYILFYCVFFTFFFFFNWRPSYKIKTLFRRMWLDLIPKLPFICYNWLINYNLIIRFETPDEEELFLIKNNFSLLNSIVSKLFLYYLLLIMRPIESDRYWLYQAWSE